MKSQRVRARFTLSATTGAGWVLQSLYAFFDWLSFVSSSFSSLFFLIYFLNLKYTYFFSVQPNNKLNRTVIESPTMCDLTNLNEKKT